MSPRVLFGWLVMPLGSLMPSPQYLHEGHELIVAATFFFFFYELLQPHLGVYVVVYFDDILILIYSRSLREHVHLRKMLV